MPGVRQRGQIRQGFLHQKEEQIQTPWKRPCRCVYGNRLLLIKELNQAHP